ncbi:MAG: sensor histidine kinase, partial [Leadbetterella sp.]
MQINSHKTHTSFKAILDYYTEAKENLDSANKYSDLYIRYAQKIRSPQTFAEAFSLKANLIRSSGDWVQLIETGHKATRIADSLKIKLSVFQKSIITDEILYGYIFLKDLESLVKYADQTLKELKSENHDGKNNLQISMIYLTLARGHGHLQEYKKAEHFLENSLEFVSMTHDTLKKYRILNDVVSNKVELKNYKMALPVALKCLTYFEKTPHNWAYHEIQMLLGRVYLGLKQYDKAVEFASKPIGKTTNLRILDRCYETLYYSYNSLGKTNKALNAFEKHIECRDKLFNEKVANEKSALEQKYVSLESQSLLNHEKLKVSVQKTYRNYFIGGTIVLALVSVGLFLNRKLLQNQKIEIETQKAQIEELNTNLEQKVEARTAELQKAYDEIKEAMQRGQSIERKRMAADLHDNLGSILTAINISLDNISPDSLTDREKRIYQNVVMMTENAYAEIRNLSHNLMPEVLEKEGLSNAIKQLVMKLNLNQKIKFSSKIENVQISHKAISLNLYASCLELVQNIIKHSKATEASISLSKVDCKIVIEVADNGTGFESKKVSGLGLTNLQNRL